MLTFDAACMYTMTYTSGWSVSFSPIFAYNNDPIDGPYYATQQVSVTVTAPNWATTTTVASSANPSNLNQSVTFTASVTSANGTPAGTVTFKDNGSTIGTATLSSGSASFSTSSLTAGSHTITAVYEGAGDFAASSGTVTQTVGGVPGAPTIGTPIAGDGQASVPFTPPASDGGLAITSYSVTSNPGALTASSASSPIVVSGLTNGVAYTFTVTATNGLGTSSPSAASSSVTPKATQTITFANPGPQSFGTAPTLSATATSGLTVVFTSATTGVCTITSAGALTFVTAGTCTINADQSGDGSFGPATTVSHSFSVNAVAPDAPIIGAASFANGQTQVTFTPPASTGGSAITSYTVISSPGGITASGTASPITVAGLTDGVAYTFTVTATNAAGAGLPSAASNQVTPTASQTITFNNPGAQSFGTTPTLTATSTSGLAVTFTSASTSVCTITTSGALAFVTAGTCTINANQVGNGVYAAAPQVQQSFAVNAIAPSAPAIGTATAGEGQASVAFTAPASDGGSAITSYIVTSSPGGIVGTGASSPIVVAGLTNGVTYTFTVTATNAAGASSSSAASNSVTPKASQTIAFNNPGAQSFGATPTLTATSTSGLAVTFTSTTTSVCIITSAGALTFATTGTCTINADQAGGGAYAAAPTVRQSFGVNAVAPSAPAIGTATAGDTQASVTFMVPASNGGSSITSYTVTASPGGLTGAGAVSPVTVSGLTNGVAYTFTVTATNGAGTSAPSAPSNAATPVSGQIITFNNPGAQAFGTTPTLTATSTSGLAVAFSSATASVCTITTGGLLTFLSSGTCTILANQAGNGAYAAAATVQQSFAVNAVAPGAPIIGTASVVNGQAQVTFTPPASTGGAAVTRYTATSNPGNISGTGTSSPIMIPGLAGGVAYTFTVTATNSAGTSSPSAASNSVTPVASQNITFNNPGAQAFGTTLTLTATASSGLPVAFTSAATGVCTVTPGGALTFVTTGTCAINANQPGDASHLAAPTVTQSFSVAQANQTVSFTSTAPVSASVGGSTYTPTATASSGLAVSFTVDGTSSSVCAMAGGAVRFTGAGTCRINANQPGNSNYNAAPQVQQSFAVGAGSQTVSFTSAPPASAIVGGATYTPVATASSGLSVSLTIDPWSSTVCTISGGVVSFTGAGTCRINANQAGNANFNAAPQVQQSMNVAPGAVTLSVVPSSPTPTYGAPVTFTATVAPSTATGTMTIKEGGRVYGSAPLVNGTVSIVASTLDAGRHSITAEYSGDLRYAATSANVIVDVQRAPTSLALAVSNAAPALGASVAFTATIQPTGAGGGVTFMDGATQIGTATLSNGVAMLSTTALAAGAHQITAVYAGDANHAPATSPARTVTVASTLVILTSSIPPPMLGSAYSQTIATSGGVRPVTCVITGGQLPAGLSLAPATCTISGTPRSGVTFAFTLTASDSAGGSASRVFTGVIARPDPTKDSTVSGLASAQVSQALRFARSQSSFVQQRLERLHEDVEECDRSSAAGASICVTFSNGVSVSQAQPPRAREEDARQAFAVGFVDPAARQPRLALRRGPDVSNDNRSGAPAAPDALLERPDARAFGGLPNGETVAVLTAGGARRASAPTPEGGSRQTPRFTPLALNLWSAGSIEIGRYSQLQQNFGAKLDDKFRTNGLAIGLDTKLWPGLKAGMAVGFGADTNEIGSDGSKSTATNASVTFYASQKIAPSLFLDGLIGYGALRLDARRLQGASGDWLEGERRGSVLFGTLKLTSEQKRGAFRVAPHVSLTAIQARLNAYSESGNPDWTLSYAKAQANALDAAVGVRLGYDIPMSWGVMTPILRMQYQYMFMGSMMQSMGYSVDPATTFSLVDAARSHWQLDGSAGVMLKGSGGISGGLEATTSAGGGRRGVGIRANVRAAF